MKDFIHKLYSSLEFKATLLHMECCPWWLRQQRICLQCRRPGFDSWVGKIPWRREWQLTPVFLPGKSHGQGSLAGYNPWSSKELDTFKWSTNTFTSTWDAEWTEWIKKKKNRAWRIFSKSLQVASVVSDSVRPHRRQPTRLCHPWDSPGKNPGVGCHFLLQLENIRSHQILSPTEEC